MCEAKADCKVSGKFWVQKNDGNLIVCGRHLPATVKKFAEYDVGKTFFTVVKVRDEKWNIWR